MEAAPGLAAELRAVLDAEVVTDLKPEDGLPDALVVESSW